MERTLSIVIIAIAVLFCGFFALNWYIYDTKQARGAETLQDATYVIEGERVTLKDGVAETAGEGGASDRIVTRYFGNDVKLDINGDAVDDSVFLLTQERGGSGTFFYVAGALSSPGGFIGSQAVLIGDRIAPQTTELSRNPSHRNVIVVNYADRAQGEPMTARPSVGKSLYLKLDPETLQFGVVEPDFEGEADPARMTLTMKTWAWQRTLLNDGSTVAPREAGRFSVTFLDDGGFSATTDCNSVGGSYSATDGSIEFSDMVMTKMYCEGSQEALFAQYLSDSTGYHFTSKGELILDLKFDSGSVVFR